MCGIIEVRHLQYIYSMRIYLPVYEYELFFILGSKTEDYEALLTILRLISPQLLGETVPQDWSNKLYLETNNSDRNFRCKLYF